MSTSSPTVPAAPVANQANQRPVPPAASKRVKPRTIILSLVALGLAAWGIHFAIHSYHYEYTDDAYLTGHLHRVSTQVSGLVKTVHVRENEKVHAGQILLELDPLEFEIAVQKGQAAIAQANAQQAQATAALEQAKARLLEADARAVQAESQVAQLDAQRSLARANLSRTQRLFENNNGAATQADYDNALSAANAAEAAYTAGEANVKALKAGMVSAQAAQEAASAQITAAKANLAAAEAILRDAERQRSYTVVTAPTDGRIGNKSVETGNRVQAGQSLFAVAESEIWVVANFKETQLAHMRTGQTAEITVDAIPGQALHGTIESFSPASGAQFALLPPDNATGNFNKVVQRVPVKIVFDQATREQLGDRLRLGLSVLVDVHVR